MLRGLVIVCHALVLIGGAPSFAQGPKPIMTPMPNDLFRPIKRVSIPQDPSTRPKAYFDMFEVLFATFEQVGDFELAVNFDVLGNVIPPDSHNCPDYDDPVQTRERLSELAAKHGVEGIRDAFYLAAFDHRVVIDRLLEHPDSFEARFQIAHAYVESLNPDPLPIPESMANALKTLATCPLVPVSLQDVFKSVLNPNEPEAAIQDPFTPSNHCSDMYESKYTQELAATNDVTEVHRIFSELQTAAKAGFISADGLVHVWRYALRPLSPLPKSPTAKLFFHHFIHSRLDEIGIPLATNAEIAHFMEHFAKDDMTPSHRTRSHYIGAEAVRRGISVAVLVREAQRSTVGDSSLVAFENETDEPGDNYVAMLPEDFLFYPNHGAPNRPDGICFGYSTFALFIRVNFVFDASRGQLPFLSYLKLFDVNLVLREESGRGLRNAGFPQLRDGRFIIPGYANLREMTAALGPYLDRQKNGLSACYSFSDDDFELEEPFERTLLQNGRALLNMPSDRKWGEDGKSMTFSQLHAAFDQVREHAIEHGTVILWFAWAGSTESHSVLARATENENELLLLDSNFTYQGNYTRLQKRPNGIFIEGYQGGPHFTAPSSSGQHAASSASDRERPIIAIIAFDTIDDEPYYTYRTHD